MKLWIISDEQEKELLSILGNHPLSTLIKELPISKPYEDTLFLRIEKLPEKLHIGRKVKYQWDYERTQPYDTGAVISHYINNDDCSCRYGKIMYQVRRDRDGQLHSVEARPCQLLD